MAYLQLKREVAASGESFDSRYSAERAAENVRRNAGGASGPSPDVDEIAPGEPSHRGRFVRTT